MLKKILILGSNSFSGNHLVGYLLKKQFAVIGCSQSDQSDQKFNALNQLPNKLKQKYKFKKININKDFIKLKNLILGFSFQFFFQFFYALPCLQTEN